MDIFNNFMKTPSCLLFFFDRVPDLLQFPKVISNNYESTFEATVKLIKAGVKRPVFIATEEPLYTSIERRRGFQAALTSHSIKFSDEMILECSDDMDKNYSIIRRLLSGKKRLMEFSPPLKNMPLQPIRYVRN